MSRVKRMFLSDLYQTWVGVGVLACVLVGLVASLGLGIYVNEHNRRLSNYLYSRCLLREHFDQAQTDARRALVRDLDDRIVQEGSNRFIDAKLRAARVSSAKRTKAAMLIAISSVPPPGCARYKP